MNDHICDNRKDCKHITATICDDKKIVKTILIAVKINDHICDDKKIVKTV